MQGPTYRYPDGPITPHGAYHILHDKIPQVYLISYDGTIVFNMMGGLSIHDPTRPERVNIVNMKGLIPPWQNIRQKGATQDGSSFVDALYDETQVGLDVVVKGRNPNRTRRTYRHLIDSIDAKQTCELGWITRDLGHWWADVRWDKTMDDDMAGITTNRQKVALRLCADNSFWRSYDNVTDFHFLYEDMTDTFNFTDTDDLGTGWTLGYVGAGPGHISANGSQAVWVEAGATNQRTMAARKNSFTTETDNQVVSIVLGSFAEWHFESLAYNDIWARMPTSGTVGAEGIRLRIGVGIIRLSYFVGGVETVLRNINWFNIFDPDFLQSIIPPLPGDKWQLVAGYEGDPRTFKVMRNGATVMTVKETGTGSPMGASNRAVGFGMEAGVGVLGQAAPSAVRKISAGDNSSVSQKGFLERINVGDQPMWDRYICFGPGVFRFSNGPGSTDMVQFGPLLPNQVMYLQTDPGLRGVDDLTSTPPSPQERIFYQKAMEDFMSFATANNVPQLLAAQQSHFGINAPQGEPYSLLSGRWSNPIPAKSPGKPAQKYHIRVEIDDGNADSQVIAAGTPRRRNPY